jgi:hypothetical protein
MSASSFGTTWLESANKMPPRVSIPIGATLLLAVGFVDWVTGPRIALSLL